MADAGSPRRSGAVERMSNLSKFQITLVRLPLTCPRNLRCASRTRPDGDTWCSWAELCSPTWYVFLTQPTPRILISNTSPDRRQGGHVGHQARVGRTGRARPGQARSEIMPKPSHSFPRRDSRHLHYPSRIYRLVLVSTNNRSPLPVDARFFRLHPPFP